MVSRAHAHQMGIISSVFLLLVVVTYAYVEFASIDVSAQTYVIMQLTVLINVGILLSLAGAVYLTER